MFTAYPTYPRRRPLKLYEKPLRGEDVYALQNALNAVDKAGLVADGVFGANTSRAVLAYQRHKGVAVVKVIDSIAGLQTQASLATDINAIVADETKIPANALRGQSAHESGNWLGIYSDLHDANTDHPSWDCGMVQENSRVFEPKRGFNPLLAVRDLAERIDEHFKHFTNINSSRRLRLAQGSWNAPAWACYLAYEEGARNDWVKAHKSRTLNDVQRRTIEEYIQHVSAFYS